MDFNKKLEKLVCKYNINDKRKWTTIIKSNLSIQKGILNIYQSITSEGYKLKYVIIDGYAESYLDDIFGKYLDNINIICWDDHEKISMVEYCEKDFILICGSIHAVWKIENELYNKNVNCRICNVYEWLWIQGEDLKTDFGHYLFKQGLKDFVYIIYSVVKDWDWFYPIFHFWAKKFRLSTNREWESDSKLYCLNRARNYRGLTEKERRIYKENWLNILIKYRDFVALKEFSQDPINLDLFSKPQYKNFMNELEILLEELRGILQKRQQEDIILMHLDAISYSRMDEFAYLSDLISRKNVISLDNAYTPMPCTTTVLKSVLSGWRPIEERLYSVKAICNKLPFIKWLENHGYLIKYFGTYEMQEKLFPHRYVGVAERKNRSIVSSRYMWECLNFLVNSPQKVFVINHFVNETHPPYFSLGENYFEYDGYKVEESQKQTASRWLDKEIKWFDSYLKKDILEIYYGDHGDPLACKYSFEKNRVNVMVLIRNSKQEFNYLTKEMFSLSRMSYLIRYCLGEKIKESEIFSDTVITVDYDRYSEKHINKFLSDNKLLADYEEWMQFRQIRTREDALVVFFNGKEKYYRLPDEKTNRINDCEYKNRIQELKNLLGNCFVDIYSEEFFKRSRKLYAEYEKLLK